MHKAGAALTVLAKIAGHGREDTTETFYLREDLEDMYRALSGTNDALIALRRKH